MSGIVWRRPLDEFDRDRFVESDHPGYLTIEVWVGRDIEHEHNIYLLEAVTSDTEAKDVPERILIFRKFVPWKADKPNYPMPAAPTKAEITEAVEHVKFVAYRVEQPRENVFWIYEEALA